MPTRYEPLLCRYHYDPLDRLIGHTLPDEPEFQRFYCKKRLVTEIQGTIKNSIFQHDDQLLAQQSHSDKLDTRLLITDCQRSVLHTLGENNQRQPIAYSPYGHRLTENGLTNLLGFNGERADLVTGHYLLGNGYRTFNPVLMRFNSPDKLSPFGRGGVNTYMYCLGDPINKIDPTGGFPIIGWILRQVGLRPTHLGHEAWTRRWVPAQVGKKAYSRVAKLNSEIADLAVRAENGLWRADEITLSIGHNLQEPSMAAANKYSFKNSHADDGYISKLMTDDRMLDPAKHRPLFEYLGALPSHELPSQRLVPHLGRHLDPELKSAYGKRLASVRTDEMSLLISKRDRIRNKYMRYGNENDYSAGR
ncbi:RHS repeat-associated core domain-containing protein [Pseudomonas sp. NFIX10]|uniref:RHS repeat-associated core domain-containing protein n=1 Tax=unclassified Pseudomonas TaxID=196821 RepID=UPI0008E962B2|nr:MULTISPECIES: RHS repeat-associated core domain-containing protein [unclassified Pseudomonas]SFA94003.1 RHS repeat-associated core domain-containing protein [Pseudomonas sp. NFIX10]SFE41506.1 RHS repeat-associated core domain-containing protein [Pseudomonas sp. NFACC06-1]